MYKKGYIDKDGYRIIQIKGVKFREHRYVMMLHLGRELLITEVVHHKDHNKLNNDISNLELVENSSEHNKKHHSSAWNKGKVTINKHKCVGCGANFQTIRQPKRKYCGRKCSSKIGQKFAAMAVKKHEICLFKGCNNNHCAKGMCRKHYYYIKYRNEYNNGAYLKYLTKN